MGLGLHSLFPSPRDVPVPLCLITLADSDRLCLKKNLSLYAILSPATMKETSLDVD